MAHSTAGTDDRNFHRKIVRATAPVHIWSMPYIIAPFRYRTLLGAFSIAITMTLSSGVQAAAATDGFYANSQAAKGHQLFNNHCAECHRPDLTGAMGPALIGKPLAQHWVGKPVEALYPRLSPGRSGHGHHRLHPEA
jgi:mono/diheme cytochrome c family protein